MDPLAGVLSRLTRFQHRLGLVQRDVIITIDNYTTPFEGLAAGRRILVERVTYHSIVQHLVDLIGGGFVRQSYFVGRDLPPSEPLPWFNQRRFRESTVDLTESTAADAAFGFSASEIRALWRVAFPRLNGMSDPLCLVDPSAAENDGRRYSMRNILDTLDDLKSCQSDAERIAFRPKAPATFINLDPEYTLQLGDSDAFILARVGVGKPTEWAPDCEPLRRIEKPSTEPLARHYAMLADRDERLRLLAEDPTVDIPGLIRLNPGHSDHLSAIHEDMCEPSHQSQESHRRVQLGACPRNR